MKVGIFVFERATGERIWQWLKSADFDHDDGRGKFEWTTKESEALAFDGIGDAFRFYGTQSTVHPFRTSDGRPNRPFTAYTVQMRTLRERPPVQEQ
jgi:hypothetical protein